MSQDEILALLKSVPTEWLSRKQIATRLNTSQGAISTNLKKLREAIDVLYKMTTPPQSKGPRHYVYRHREEK